MVSRPVFIAYLNLVHSEMIDFTFHSGFSVSQKQKSIASLHENILKKYPDKKILEVSTKSMQEAGVMATNFNLSVTLKSGKRYRVEQLYQSSKVFDNGYSLRNELPFLDSKAMKRKIRELSQHDLVEFNQYGQVFPLEPKSFFYNWLYINALNKTETLKDEILEFDAFTDIEFNPKKSISSQAEACAIYEWLERNGLLERALADKENFFDIVYGSAEEKNIQLDIFSL